MDAKQLRESGFSDNEIKDYLVESGFTDKEVSDYLNPKKESYFAKIAQLSKDAAQMEGGSPDIIPIARSLAAGSVSWMPDLALKAATLLPKAPSFKDVPDSTQEERLAVANKAGAKISEALAGKQTPESEQVMKVVSKPFVKLSEKSKQISDKTFNYIYDSLGNVPEEYRLPEDQRIAVAAAAGAGVNALGESIPFILPVGIGKLAKGARVKISDIANEIKAVNELKNIETPKLTEQAIIASETTTEPTKKNLVDYVGVQEFPGRPERSYILVNERLPNGKVTTRKFNEATDEIRKTPSDQPSVETVTAPSSEAQPAINKEPWEMTLGEFIESPFVMSESLRRLHEHKARVLGLDIANDSIVNSYLKRLSKYVNDNLPAQAKLMDDALTEYYKGNYRKATELSERILTQGHENETARVAMDRMEDLYNDIIKQAIDDGKPVPLNLIPENSMWKITRKEYINSSNYPLIPENNPSRESLKLSLESNHKKLVTTAIKEGKPVPPEVLAEYPNLQKQVIEPPLEAPETAVEPQAESGAMDVSSEAIKSQPSLDSIIPEVRGGMVNPNRPRYAQGSSINLDKFNTTEDVKQFTESLTRRMEESIDKRRISLDETRNRAEELGWNAKDVVKQFKKKGAFTSTEMDAARQVNLNTLVELQDKIKNIPADQTSFTPEQRAEILDAMDLVKATSQASSEAGRALNVHKRILNHDPAFKRASQINRVLKVITDKGGKRTDALINALRTLDFNDIASVNRFIYYATTTPWSRATDRAFALWINFLLSNPMTHIRNTTSNALTFAYTYPEKALMSGIDYTRSKITGTKQERYLGEGKEALFSIKSGILNGVQRGLEAFKEGDFSTKLDYTQAIFPKEIEKYLPTRALTIQDAFAKGLVEQQQIARLAYRKAKMEGLKGDAFRERVIELSSNPTMEMLEKAVAEGKYLTYQKELGRIGSAIMKFRTDVPGLRYFIPFVKTPTNIAKFALERTPLNLPIIISKAIKGELKGGALSEELAKPLMGTILGYLTYELAKDGHITGGSPKSKAERDEKLSTGWLPYSVKVDDTYYSFAGLEPLASVLGMAADLYQIQDQASEDEKYNIAAGIAGSITNNISDKTFMQGISNLIMFASDPTRYGKKVINTLGGSFVPSVLAGISRSTDPYVRDVKDVKQAMMNRIPGVSETLPAKLTPWGEPIERQSKGLYGFLSPIQKSKEKGSLLEKELERLNLDIGYPSRKIGWVELSQDEYWDMVKRGGIPAKKKLDKLIQSPKWERMDDAERETKIKSIVNRNRDIARTDMFYKLRHEGRLNPTTPQQEKFIKNKR